jgi:hypothetical protein
MQIFDAFGGREGGGLTKLRSLWSEAEGINQIFENFAVRCVNPPRLLVFVILSPSQIFYPITPVIQINDQTLCSAL